MGLQLAFKSFYSWQQLQQRMVHMSMSATSVAITPADVFGNNMYCKTMQGKCSGIFELVLSRKPCFNRKTNLSARRRRSPRRNSISNIYENLSPNEIF